MLERENQPKNTTERETQMYRRALEVGNIRMRNTEGRNNRMKTSERMSNRKQKFVLVEGEILA
jgi:hypothetical protein